MKANHGISRQQMARDQQQYDPHPLMPFCENCGHYKSSWIEDGWGAMEEKKRRCSLGGFAVKRKGTCRNHQFSKDVLVG